MGWGVGALKQEGQEKQRGGEREELQERLSRGARVSRPWQSIDTPGMTAPKA